MSHQTTLKPRPGRSETARNSDAGRKRGQRLGRLNIGGGLAGWLWLIIIIIPIYYVIISSFKKQEGFFASNALLPPVNPTVENYVLVLQSGIAQYFINSVTVTAGAVIPAVFLSFMAAYGIVRNTHFAASGASRMFLLGLAIPLQATIVPLYFGITRLSLYDSLLAIILPTIAFAIPVSVLVLSNFLRDVPNELFESMKVDGATEWRIMWSLVFPILRPAIVTIAIYNALNAWNGFLLPLILTQSPDKRTLPLSLWAFQGEFSANIPAILAAVTLSVIPLVVLYTLGRRQLVAGLTAGFSK